MKKLFAILLSVALLLSLGSFALASEVKTSLTKEQVLQFSDLGFSEAEIAAFDDWEIEKYSHMSGKVISKVEKYYRIQKNSAVEISKDQALKEVLEYEKNKTTKKSTLNNDKSTFRILSGGSDTEQCSWLTVTTTVTDTGSKHYLMKNSFTWLTSPWWYLTDVIGLTHNSSISITQDSEYLKVSYDKYLFPTYIGVQNDYYWTADTKNSSGYAFKYDLKYQEGDYTLINPRGYMIYEGVATPSSFVGYSNAYGHYQHQQMTSSISISLFSGTMSVSPSWAFNAAPDTDAQFYIQ